MEEAQDPNQNVEDLIHLTKSYSFADNRLELSIEQVTPKTFEHTLIGKLVTPEISVVML